MPATLADIQRKYGESVYPLYKDQMHEPYMPNKKGGYRGVVLYDENEDKIRCEECGGWFESLTYPHLHLHKMTQEEYREKNGLLKKAALVSKRISKIHSDTAAELRRSGRMRVRGFEEKNLDNNQRKLQREQTKKAKKKVGHDNNYGLCEAQIAARIMVVKKQVGRDNINSADLRKYDKKLINALAGRFGSIEKAMLNLNIPTVGSGNNQSYEDAFLIGLLRSWVIEHKSIPKTRDLKTAGGSIPVSAPTFYKHFGSWRRAKMMAGLDQLLEEVKG